MIVQNKPNNYLILNEESNAVDYLVRSYDFLNQIENNRVYLKWFIIAYHGALYSFMILVLSRINSMQIFKEKDGKVLIENDLLSFLKIYSLLKNKNNMGRDPYVATNQHDLCMKELNNKLRNLMVHFKPMLWASEPWYPAEACYPLIDILKFCINRVQFRHSDKTTLLSYIDNIEKILYKHKKQPIK